MTQPPSTLKRKLGQNTAEYLILLVLLAVGSIGIFQLFGGTMKKQVANVVAAFTGNTAQYTITKQNLDAASAAAITKSKVKSSMAGADDADVSIRGEAE